MKEERKTEGIFRIFHVTRHVAAHNYELDDKLYGTPEVKDKIDWPLEDPRLYLQRLKNDLMRVETALDDLSYLMRSKGFAYEVPERPSFTLEEAALHAFHKFHVRQFTYVEMLQYELQNRLPEQIFNDINISKAKRQFSILLAAREDLIVSIVRFSAYAEEMELKK